tara:strand:- start:137 stop:745 length:609 start_codon:yes stop_codon:yes gene_type:complete
MKETHNVARWPAWHFIEKVPGKLVDIIVEELQEMDRNNAVFLDASVGGHENGRKDLNVRNSKIHWWYEDHWACSLMSHYIGVANKRNWEYDLNMLESIQVSVYTGKDQSGGEGGHYGWHSDYGTSKSEDWTRKLSASLLVSDPSEYEGGDLILLDYHNNEVKMPKEKGSIIVFDSRLPHKVTPVTTGKRISLVTWMYGPKLR